MDDVVVTKVVTAQVKSLESLLQELQSAVCVGILVLLRGLSFFSFSWHAIIMTVILQIKIANTCRKNDENVYKCMPFGVSRQENDTKSLQVGWWANPFHRGMFGWAM